MMEMRTINLYQGNEVKTPYGWGVLQFYDKESDKVVIALDSWELKGSFIPTLFSRSSVIEQSSFAV